MPNESSPPGGRLSDAAADRLRRLLFDRIDKIDRAEIAERVHQLRAGRPDASPDELADLLIKAKCQKAAAVGAVTTSGTLLPGIGSVVAGTAGLVADLRAVVTLQAELVLEISEVYGSPIGDTDRQPVVMLLIGLGYGTSELLTAAGTKLTAKVAARIARNWLTRALPVIGVATSASSNALSTYVVGQRAKAYFSRGPDAVGDWVDTLRTIAGVDERRIVEWLSERRVEANDTLAAAATSANTVLANVRATAGRSAARAGRGARRVGQGVARARRKTNRRKDPARGISDPAK